jgi:transglutaminase-like putative cysteine protease
MKIFGFSKSKNKTAQKSTENAAYQVPRTSLAWLLCSLVAVILPHVLRMPVWLVVICALCIIGRVLIYQGRMSYPGPLIKTIVVALILWVMVAQFGRDVFATESTVAILIVAISLKLLEMHKKRDVIMVVYLCYFTVIAEFIWSQSIPIAVYIIFCVLLISASLLSLSQTEEYQKPVRTLKLSGLILLQSVPLMLALFILFPRISPLWSVPLQNTTGRTGLSDSMSPGDIGDLIGSDELAFRVKFNGDNPRPAELYWRAITLDSFDGREWTRGFNVEPQFLGGGARNRDWFENIEFTGNILDYNIIMEPTDENWIYSLKIPQMLDDRMIMRRDFQVDSIRTITQRFSYDMRSHLSNRLDPFLSQRELRRWRRLPDEGNERSREFAIDLREQSASDEEFIQNVLTFYRSENFFYTLQPALLGENPVDEFLFNTREGFCEHYSSSFTYLMRAVGIPARVVTGYQGGEYNPYDDTLAVRQYDAHAWSEVWLQDQGWVRVDPTAAVAPDRIEQGSQFAFQLDEVFLQDAGLSLLRFRNSLFLNDLRYRLEMIDYSWNRFVLNYDQGMQFAFFSRLFDEVTREKIIISVLGFIFVSISIMVFFVLRKPSRKALHPATELYLGYCDGLAKQGFVREKGETPLAYLSRLSSVKPNWAKQMREITEKYIDLVYKTPDPALDPSEVKDFKNKIRQFHMLLY